MAIPEAYEEWFDRLHEFSKHPDALFFPMKTVDRGAVPIWADDIRACGDDNDLLYELIRKILEE